MKSNIRDIETLSALLLINDISDGNPEPAPGKKMEKSKFCIGSNKKKYLFIYCGIWTDVLTVAHVPLKIKLHYLLI